MKRILFFCAAILLLITGGVVRSQTELSKRVLRYDIVRCLSREELLQSRPELKSAEALERYAQLLCSVALGSGEQPVLYMGRAEDGRHMILVKVP
jgi:hypothetical protein